MLLPSLTDGQRKSYSPRRMACLLLTLLMKNEATAMFNHNENGILQSEFHRHQAYISIYVPHQFALTKNQHN